MPIVRLSRDKRGLDTLYLIDTRQDGRSRGARVLYFWTAPPGLRVGRDPLDASRQRSLEQAYPDVDFDWPELTRAAESALQQAAALSLEAKREPWRAGGARASRSGQAARGARVTPADPASADAAPGRNRTATVPPAEIDAAQTAAPDSGVPTDPSVPPSENDGTPSARSRRRRRRARRPGSGGESPPPDL